MKYKFLTGVLLTVFLLPHISFAETIPAGIQGKLWFSKDSLTEGETITVFALVYNSSEHRIDGEIALHDSTTTISKKPFSLLSYGGSQVVSFPVLISSGAHVFSATLRRVTLVGRDDATIGIDPVLAVTTTTPERRVAHALVRPPLSSSNASSSLPAFVSAVKVLATTSSEVVGETLTSISESAPISVASRAIPIIGNIESYRKGESQKSEKRIASIAENLAHASETGTSSIPGIHPQNGWEYLSKGFSEGGIWKTPFEYVKIFLLLIWNFLTAHVVVFYVLILLVLYKIIRAILGVFF